ncbi:uncharacterized protein Z518_06385 [Rhinocladiella mackenziei CBS 650.93]|uniref:F-box domain-containing protein n=1 Tax=Rhinocladiella mackenziei CBS 650.93 TaxID=1442369 RepID=A0A0D2H552_9EURO|nr:uncharacterized protein Z518_06385 [Rhinocladiella mackenziei CBS 650.93]KIX05513.1 hypothetical protein Z518_06385 [Rhinocladiella mackenziei CBS 650.93]
MLSGFNRLPFDILYQVASQLDIRSHDSLGKTCRNLYQHLRDENTAKNSLQASVCFSTWAQLALSTQKTSFRQTIGRYVDCHQALQTASPYAACVIAYATSFSYYAGILCYSTCASLRILDFNTGRSTEKVISGSVFTNRIVTTSRGNGNLDLESLKSIQVHGYASEIVILACDFGSYGKYIFAVNISETFCPPPRPNLTGQHRRILLCIPLRSTSKLFVRHNHRYMIVGTHSAMGNYSHHEWLLQGYDFETSEPVTKEPLQLRDFFGSEIGSTVCFTIYRDVFYALTNQTSVESEEVDWTSYYHFISFRVDDPTPELKIQTIWRRQHLEGPINDAWTDLGFQEDHRSGELLVVECRKEWANGGSRSIRTYYTQPFHRAEHKGLNDSPEYPPDDRLRLTLDEKSKSRYEPPRPRVDRYVHAEFQDGVDEFGKEYIRAKTKWNGYQFNAQSFVDLVTEEVKIEDEWRPRERIKVRVVSRNELNPLVPEKGSMDPRALIVRPCRKDREGENMEDGEEWYGPSRVAMWPPDDAPQELHDILCPSGRAGDVKAILGDEGIVYMAGPPREPGSPERALVFVSFDPSFGFEGMKRLNGTLAKPKTRDGSSPQYRKRKSVSNQDVDMNTGESISHTVEPGLTDRTKRIKNQPVHLGSPALPARAPLPVEPTSEPLAPKPWPPLLPESMESPLPSLSPPCSGSASGSGQSPDKRKSGSMKLPTWREKAMYLSIAKGFWLR